jgi:hypothetical protein
LVEPFQPTGAWSGNEVPAWLLDLSVNCSRSGSGHGIQKAQ